jgi:hypothetical protein
MRRCHRECIARHTQVRAAALMDPFVSLLEIHKRMYFMQAAGEALRLRYIKALYGNADRSYGRRSATLAIL